MTIAFECRCGRTFEFLDVHAGKTFRCPRCRSRLSVPIPDVPTEIQLDAHLPPAAVEDEGASTEYPIVSAAQDGGAAARPAAPAAQPTRPARASSGEEFDPYATIDPALQEPISSITSSPTGAISRKSENPQQQPPRLEDLARMVEDLRRRVEHLEARARRDGDG